MSLRPQTIRIGAATLVILCTIIYLAITGVESNKSYYVTIGELQAMGDKAYTRHLRVAGDVAPNCSFCVERTRTHAACHLPGS
jgi:cytochrome c-type biogenesis protein CcmE